MNVSDNNATQHFRAFNSPPYDFLIKLVPRSTDSVAEEVAHPPTVRLSEFPKSWQASFTSVTADIATGIVVNPTRHYRPGSCKEKWAVRSMAK